MSSPDHSLSAITDDQARALLRRLHAQAIAAVQPAVVMAGHVPAPPKGRCVVIGAGKAAAAMAAALDTALLAAWEDAVAVSGLVATRYGHAVPAGRISVIEAGHPTPDANSLIAAQRIVAALDGLTADDLVIALISGGGSAVMEWPVDGLDLAGLQTLNTAMLASGATIGEINTVRRHLSRVKGGQLGAMAAPARLVTLLISDIPGDTAADIASGPTLADHTTPADARAIIARYHLPVPDRALAALDHRRARVVDGEYHIIASARHALAAAAGAARAIGLNVLDLGDGIECEAKDCGLMLAGIALSAQRSGAPVRAPAVLLSGGETTVPLGSHCGKGGRNTECALGMALGLRGAAGIWALTADSDGIDGSEDAAGALIAPDTLARADAWGLDPRAFLQNHDSYSLFKALDDLLITGPSLTNVNDIRICLIANGA